ncbi:MULTISPECIES: hypothetical protein [unclassified Nocardiopsis]|uniref:hypothetical protein n=1 Tax=unclassified Nocardiopsis TaxID=2649073 RepID=UPI0013571F86|nr:MULTISPECIES: hypothetical protein [unclassified Nocardiopsis]
MYDENAKREIARLVETQRKLRGHDFLPSDAELAKIPGAYETEDVRESFKKVHLHYFTPGADWWLVEVWQENAGTTGEPPLWMGFGYTRFASMPDGAEWGYVSLNELEELNVRPQLPAPPPYPQAYVAIVPQIIVERDLNFTPQPAHKCIPGIPAPADDYGYPWVLAFERLNDTDSKSEIELEQQCIRAAIEGAPEGAYRFEDGEWKTIDQAGPELKSLLEPYVKAVAEDE